MVGLEMPRHCRRVLSLVVFGSWNAHRKRAGDTLPSRHHRDDETGIDPTGEKRAYGNICEKALSNRAVEHLFQALLQCFNIAVSFLVIEIPRSTAGQPVWRENQVAGRRYFLDSCKRTAIRRHIAKSQVLGDRPRFIGGHTTEASEER